jgi:hypothetical protein
MTPLSSQTSIQAAKLIREAVVNPELELSISRSGNIRIAKGFSRSIIRLINFVNADARENRLKAAKALISEKLAAELQALGLRGNTLAPASDKLTTLLTDPTANTSSLNLSQASKLESDLAKAVGQIRAISEIAEGKQVKFFWKAIGHQRSAGQAPNVHTAMSVARKAMEWMQTSQINEKAAFQASINAHRLLETKRIPLDQAKQILELAGRLANRHSFSREAALQFAIDNQSVLQRLGVGMDTIERTMKSLTSHVPKFHQLPEQTRISAAIRYLQLQSVELGNMTPIDEVRQSIADLDRLQQAMPEGCVIDQIHQGSHIRGKISLAQMHFGELESKAASLNRYPLYTQSEIHGVTLPENFRNFEKQFVEDLVRGTKFELRTNNRVDVEFMKSEEKRRQNPKKLAEEEYRRWAEHRFAWAGSGSVAETLSRFESQTFFGDVETVTGQKFLNQGGHSLKAYGDTTGSKFSLSANHIHNQTGDYIELTASRLVHATLLDASPSEERQQDLLIPAPQQLPLIQDPVAFTVKRECILKANVEDLEKKLTRCQVVAVTEEWDIQLDWDAWRLQRTPVGIL